MRYINKFKKFNEMFDDFDIKSSLEHEYQILGKKNFLKNFKKIEHLFDESTKKFFNRLLNKYNVIGIFNLDEFEKEGLKAILAYATSFKKIDGIDHYGNIMISYHDDKYQMSYIFRDLKNTHDQDKWLSKTLITEDFNKCVKFLSDFLDMCIRFNIITKEQKVNLQAN